MNKNELINRLSKLNCNDEEFQAIANCISSWIGPIEMAEYVIEFLKANEDFDYETILTSF